jgi:hypothetical protein
VTLGKERNTGEMKTEMRNKLVLRKEEGRGQRESKKWPDE